MAAIYHGNLRLYSAEAFVASICLAVVFAASLFGMLTRKDKFLTLGDPARNKEAQVDTLVEIREYVLLGTYPIPVETDGGTHLDTYYLIGLLDPSDQSYSGFLGMKKLDADTNARDYAVAYQDALNRKSIETLRIEGTLKPLSPDTIHHARDILTQAGLSETEIAEKLFHFEIRSPRQGAKDTGEVDALFVTTLLSGTGAVALFVIFLFLHHGVKKGFSFSNAVSDFYDPF